MSATSNDEVFDEAMQCLKEGSVVLGQAKDGALQGWIAYQQHGDEFQDDPRMATIKALECFFENVAIPRTKNSATRELVSKWCARLVDSGLVNVLIGCLPDCEAFERYYRDVQEVVRILDGFQEFLKYLRTALGKNFNAVCEADELVAGLFNMRPRSAAPEPGSLDWYRFLQNDLRLLAWHMRGIKQHHYMRHTFRLLEYLKWEVQGRKDLTCRVQKSGTFLRPEELNKSAPSNLSLLFPEDSYYLCTHCFAPGATLQCALCLPSRKHQTVSGIAYCNETCLESHKADHAASCEETRRLIRSASLFQIAFTLYLLVTRGDNDFTVANWYGVVIKTQISKPPHYDGTDAMNAILDDPNDAAGLHTLRCTAIQGLAQELLEYFIRPSCKSIEFRHFCPKNAELTVTYNGLNNISAAHTVGLLTTPSGRQFAFDPTAAQFGWKENLAPWEAYRRRRVDKEYGVDTCDSLDRERVRTKQTPMPADPALQQNWKCKCAAEEIAGIVDCLLGPDRLSRILDAPEDEFWSYYQAIKLDLEKSVCNSTFLQNLYKPDGTQQPLNM